MAVRFEYISRTHVRSSILTIYGHLTSGSRFPSFGGPRQFESWLHMDWTEKCGKSGMTLQLTTDEHNTVTHVLKHAYRKSELIRRIEETDYNFSAVQLDEIQGALPKRRCEAAGSSAATPTIGRPWPPEPKFTRCCNDWSAWGADDLVIGQRIAY
jgi:hypothetical protein